MFRSSAKYGPSFSNFRCFSVRDSYEFCFVMSRGLNVRTEKTMKQALVVNTPLHVGRLMRPLRGYQTDISPSHYASTNPAALRAARIAV